MIEFQGWPKTPRLFRDMIVTEKIDGTNAAVIIEEDDFEDPPQDSQAARVVIAGEGFWVGAQSRKRLITPESDNFGFAKWVFENAGALVQILGPGRHFGEWWGSGIQRGYGQTTKQFSLFNVVRYAPKLEEAEAWYADLPAADLIKSGQLRLVPVLHRGKFSLEAVDFFLFDLEREGSKAAAGFMNPEGVIVFHEAAGQVFKATIENDAEPKTKNFPLAA